MRQHQDSDVAAVIRQALLREWDPIGVRNAPEAQDEYDSYVPGIYQLLVKDASVQTIADRLAQIEQEWMGLTPNRAALLQVAGRLKQIDVHAPPA